MHSIEFHAAKKKRKIFNYSHAAILFSVNDSKRAKKREEEEEEEEEKEN